MQLESRFEDVWFIYFIFRLQWLDLCHKRHHTTCRVNINLFTKVVNLAALAFILARALRQFISGISKPPLNFMSYIP